MNTTYTDTTNKVEATMVRICLFIAGLGLVVASVLAHNAHQPDRPRMQEHPGTTIEPRP